MKIRAARGPRKSSIIVPKMITVIAMATAILMTMDMVTRMVTHTTIRTTTHTTIRMGIPMVLERDINISLRP